MATQDDLEKPEMVQPDLKKRAENNRTREGLGILKLRYTLETLAEMEDLRGPFYEFGTYRGSSLSIALHIARKLKVRFGQVFGFDSFEGLPEETPGLTLPPSWRQGAYSAAEWLGADNTDQALEMFDRMFDKFRKNGTKIRFVKGFYEQSLTPELAKELPPAGFVNVDVDLYRSAKQVLEFLFANGLIASGCVIRYDDWWGLGAGQEWTFGESLAHLEIVKEYDVQLLRIARNVFKVISYRGSQTCSRRTTETLQSAHAHRDRGLTLLEQGELWQALEDFDKAIALEPDDLLTYRVRWVTRSALGGYWGALEDINCLLAASPEEASLHYERGLLWKRLGSLERARDSFDEAIDLEVEHAFARLERGRLRRELDDIELSAASD